MFNNPYYNMNTNYGNMPRFQPIETPQPMNTQSYIPPIQNTNTQPMLLGKSVDSIEVVKAMDIPLDGSTSYFPLTDGSTIVTKKLQADGTSKTTIYKTIEEESIEQPKYVTSEELKKYFEKFDLSDFDELKEDIKDIKQELKDLRKTKKKDD